MNTSTSPKVQYAYSEMPSGANHSRLTSMTYPNGRVITSNYASGLDADISRLSELKDGSTVLEGYSYLGLGTVVKRAHPQSDVDLSYEKLNGESVGDAGDQYTGLDRFGRIVDQRWIEAANGISVDRYQYTYDRNGNRTSEVNALNTSLNETYGYDSLNQLTNFATTGTTKSWDFDALGNWDGVTTNGTIQTRSHNRQNEITAVSGQTTPVFDANGNMTTDETGKQYVYDAWNRLKIVKNSGGTTLVTYAYDPLTRRVQEVTGTTRDLYYSSQWQVIEEAVGGTPRVSYVWSPVYVDAMVARDFDSDSNGSLEQRIYPTHDANFNLTALVNTSGTVVERNTYDPFGSATARDGSWTVTSPAYSWQYLHQGGRLNADSGLYSFRHREYSPILGRWVTMDPIGFAGLSSNLYLGVDSNPVTHLDPTGLKFIDAVLSIAFPAYGLGYYVIGPAIHSYQNSQPQSLPCLGVVDCAAWAKLTDNLLKQCEEEHANNFSRCEEERSWLGYTQICKEQIYQFVSTGSGAHLFLCCMQLKSLQQGTYQLFSSGLMKCGSELIKKLTSRVPSPDWSIANPNLPAPFISNQIINGGISALPQLVYPKQDE